MNLYKALFRPLLFRLDPETAHHWTIEACHIGGKIPMVARTTRKLLSHSASELRFELCGLEFENPIGLAAGWDKSGRALPMSNHLGFGFVEIGSVSARPSLGNTKPRLFRLQDEQAIVVNYGLPNDGAEAVAGRLANNQSRVPLGVNVVKTNDGDSAPDSDGDAILADYHRSVDLLHHHASYLTLNLSCPNAKGGQDFFADRGTISRLLEQLNSIQIDCPIFLKVPPNPNPRFLERLLEESVPFDFVRGFVFNLPSGKPKTLRFAKPRSDWRTLPGAVAGKPVENLINHCIGELFSRMPRDRFVIVGAGGVFNAEDAYRKIQLGASLVQIYTAMIYEGPGLVRRINRELAEMLRRDGLRNVQDLVGTIH